MNDNLKDLALEAVLLFHSGSSWDVNKSMRWTEICARVKAERSRTDYGREFAGGWDATTKTLCNIVRAAQREQPTKGETNADIPRTNRGNAGEP